MDCSGEIPALHARGFLLYNVGRYTRLTMRGRMKLRLGGLSFVSAGLLAAALLFVFVPGAFAQLQSDATSQLGAATLLPQTPLPIIIARIIRAVLGVMGIVLTLLILYAGFLYMTAGGDQAKTAKAKNIIKNAAIGLTIAVSAFSITQFILNRLLASAGLLGGISSTAMERYAEPLGSALNGRVIRDHYPPRNALDVPRNVRIMVTFAEPVDPGSIIPGFNADPTSATLNDARVKIYPTAQREAAALGGDQVRVSVSADRQTFVFDPAPLLGNETQPVNYTVSLGSGIQTAAGRNLFSSGAYAWTFEVSTQVDLTPPKVVSAIPRAGSAHDRNVTVELTFDEAMDPVAASGVYDGAANRFSNIQTLSGATPNTPVNGTFEISNGYRTVSFTTDRACARDACGNTVYCLPASTNIAVEARAATVDTANAPQAQVVGGGVDGLVDATGNSLDGNGDGKAEGPTVDGYRFTFSTTNTIDDRTPSLRSVAPSIREALVGPNVPITFTFNMPMKASTLSNSNIQLWPDPYYPSWFVTASQGVDAAGEPVGPEGQVAATRVSISHAPFISTEEGGHNYYPVVTDDVRGNNQFCFFPAIGPATGSDQGSCNGGTAAPYCCNGEPSATACSAPRSGTTLPDTSE